MSELTEKDSGASEEKTSDATQTQDSNMLPENWEARLAVARAQREKVLKAKGKLVSKPKSVRPRFMDEDANADLRAPLAIPLEGDGTQMADGHTNADVSDTFKGTSKIGAIVGGAPKLSSKRNASSFSRVLTVAFACFFGLGFGMVLSFGAIAAMGWISWSDISPKQTLAPPNAKAPELYTTMAASIIPAPPVNIDTQIGHTALTPIVAKMRAAPTLVTTAATDQALAAIQSPALRLDTSGIANELVSQFNFQPANIAMVFANPTRPAVTQALLEVTLDSDDEIPTLLETGTVKTPIILASLTSPLVDQSVLIAARSNDVTHTRLPAPTLFKNAPGDVLSVVWAQPEKISVFEDAVPDGFSNAPIEEAHFLDILASDAPPARALPSRAATFESASIHLPFIEGPSGFKPNLAFSLGLSADDVKTYSLVTFAPTNVPDDRMASNTELLNETGFQVANINRVNFKVSKTHIRYYNKQDEKVARAIAAEVGGTVRDFTTARNSPPQGRVEVWLEGNKKKNVTASKPKRTLSTAQRRAAFKSLLEKRLVNSLRRGDHLE